MTFTFIHFQITFVIISTLNTSALIRKFLQRLDHRLQLRGNIDMHLLYTSAHILRFVSKRKELYGTISFLKQ